MRKSRFTPEYERFLAELRSVRIKKGVMQVQLAKRLGVPQQYVSRFETGETRMDVAQLWRYCRALGIQFSSFCKRLDRLFAQAR